MADRSIRVRFLGDVSSLRAAMVQAGSDVKMFGRNLSGAGTATRADMDRIGKSALVMAGVIGAGLGLSAKAAIDWESAWAGVTKTVDGSAAELADLESGLRDMAKVLPASHAEIAGVAEAAGQLGVKVGAVESFTKVMIDLGETTNLTAEEAATSLARISNIMGTASSDVERMGSTIVELGNNSATTEAEIVELATRLAAAGRMAGLSEANVFAFSSALTSVGQPAEAAGTAFSKVFQSMSDAVLDGGDNLETFARVAGTTADEFAAAFRADPALAIESFISGIGRMEAAGQSTTVVFEDLSLTDQRLMRAVRSLGGAQGLLADQIEMANGAWEENNALQTEAEKRYDTTAAKMEMAKNQLVDLGIDVGNILLPAITSAIGAVSTLARGFGEMPQGLKVGGSLFAGFVGTLAGLVGVTGVLIPKIKALRTSLIAMGGAGRFAAAAFPYLAVAAAAIGAVTYVYGQNSKRAQEAEEAARGYTDAILDQKKAVGSLTKEMAAQELLEGDAGTRFREIGVDLGVLTDAIHQSGSALGVLEKEFDTKTVSIPDMVERLASAFDAAGLGGSALATELLGLAEAGKITAPELATLLDRLAEQGGAYATGASEAENMAAATDAVGGGAESTAPKLVEMADALGLNAEEAEEAREAFEELLAAYKASVDPFFAMLDALDSNREAMGAEAEARAAGAAAVAEAADGLAEAEANLREARATPDNADGIAAAEERLADARERLTEAQQDAVISEEELAAMNREVAESALDVEIASRELAAAVREQPELLGEAVRMLQEWVAQGLITEEQAANVAAQFGVGLDLADQFASDWVASVYLVGGEEAIEELSTIHSLLGLITDGSKYSAGAAYNLWLKEQRPSAPPGGVRGSYLGGPVGHGMGAPGPGDTIPALLAPGEWVVNRQAVNALGVGTMESLNRGVLPMPGGSSGGTIEKTWAPNLTVQVLPDQDPHAAARRSLRKLALEVAG